MDFKDYIYLIRRWWWLLILGGVLGSSIGYALVQRQTPQYTSGAQLIVGQFAETDTRDIRTNAILAQIYASLALQKPILQGTVDALSLDQDWERLQDRVNTTSIQNSALFELQVTDSAPEQAQLIADEITRQLIAQVTEQNLDQELETYLGFVRDEIDDLQGKIESAREQIIELEDAIALETTTLGVSRTRDQIASLQNKITTWQKSYSGLLSFLQENKPQNLIQVVDNASLPNRPSNINLPRSILLGAVLGIFFCAGIAFLIDYFDDTIKTPENIQEETGLPTLGLIPTITNRQIRKAGQQVVTDAKYPPVIVDTYLNLRTNLEFAELKRTNNTITLLVTSANPSEGKSTTATNLAAIIAESGQQVVLIDADLRRPKLHTYLEQPNEIGLSNLLVGRALELDDLLLETFVPHLKLLPTGSAVSVSATNLLNNPRFAHILTTLAEQADWIIVDSAPVLGMADTRVLAKHVPNVLLVAESNHTHNNSFRQAVEQLNQIDVAPIGVVLNHFSPKQNRYGYYGYGYGGYQNR